MDMAGSAKRWCRAAAALALCGLAGCGQWRTELPAPAPPEGFVTGRTDRAQLDPNLPPAGAIGMILRPEGAAARSDRALDLRALPALNTLPVRFTEAQWAGDWAAYRQHFLRLYRRHGRRGRRWDAIAEDLVERAVRRRDVRATTVSGTDEELVRRFTASGCDDALALGAAVIVAQGALPGRSPVEDLTRLIGATEKQGYPPEARLFEAVSLLLRDERILAAPLERRRAWVAKGAAWLAESLAVAPPVPRWQRLVWHRVGASRQRGPSDDERRFVDVLSAQPARAPSSVPTPNVARDGTVGGFSGPPTPASPAGTYVAMPVPRTTPLIVIDPVDDQALSLVTDQADPWLRAMFRAHVFSERALQGMYDDMPQPGRPKYDPMAEYARQAKATQAAHALKPEWPEAATGLISRVLRNALPALEPQTVWFERAVRAHFDYSEAYQAMRWALEGPTGRGGVGRLAQFGAYCAAAGRPETEVALEAGAALSLLWARSSADAPAVRGLAEQLEPRLRARSALLQGPAKVETDTLRAAVLWRLGRLDELAALLARPGAVDLHGLDGAAAQPGTAIASRVLLWQGAPAEALRGAEQSLVAGRPAKAEAELRALLKTTPAEPVAERAHFLLATLPAERRLAAGQPLRLDLGDQSLPWRPGGSADPASAGEPRRRLPLHPGPRFELAGRVLVDPSGPLGGVAVGWLDRGRLVGFCVGACQPHRYVLYSATNLTSGTWLKLDRQLSGPIDLRIQYLDGRVQVTANGCAVSPEGGPAPGPDETAPPTFYNGGWVPRPQPGIAFIRDQRQGQVRWQNWTFRRLPAE